MRSNTFLGIPALGLNILSFGLSIFLVLLGVKTLKSSDIALEVANTKLITGSSAKRLEELALDLEQQATAIQQKDEAYQELEQIYSRSLKGNKGYGKLQQAIEKIEVLPEPVGINEIVTEIEATEELLLDSVTE